MAAFGFGALGAAAGAALGGVLLYANLPTRLTIGLVKPTFAYLSQAKLVPVRDENNVDMTDVIEASTLFSSSPCLVMAVRRPGCILCRREASHLSSLKPELDAAGIRFMAVVHETKGVNAFQPYFQGDVFYDQEKHFYGPNQRWLPVWMGALRIGTYINGYKSKKEGFSGNMKGEGRLLGGVHLISNGEIVWSHQEKEWGDAADVEEVRKAIQKIK